MNTSDYFVIYSKTSRNSMYGLRPQVMWACDTTIVLAAIWEMNRSGDSFECLAGIEWLEYADGSMQPARELTYDEVIALSIAKLRDDGRMYTVYPTDEAGAAAFIKAAEYHGLDDEARAIVDKFNA